MLSTKSSRVSPRKSFKIEITVVSCTKFVIIDSLGSSSDALRCLSVRLTLITKFLELDSTNDDSMYDSSFDSTETQPYFEAGSLIKLENGECKKVEELSRADFETVRYRFLKRYPTRYGSPKHSARKTTSELLRGRLRRCTLISLGSTHKLP